MRTKITLNGLNLLWFSKHFPFDLPHLNYQCSNDLRNNSILKKLSNPHLMTHNTTALRIHRYNRYKWFLHSLSPIPINPIWPLKTPFAPFRPQWTNAKMQIFHTSSQNYGSSTQTSPLFASMIDMISRSSSKNCRLNSHDILCSF